MSSGAPVIHGLGRSLTLLRVFLVVSAALLALAAVALSFVLSRAMEHRAVEDEKNAVALYGEAVLSPLVVTGGRVVVDAAARPRIARALRLSDEVRSVKIWRPDGVLAYATLAPERVGTRFPVAGHLEEALRTGEAEGELEALHADAAGEAEDVAEATLLDLDRVMEVYAPIKTEQGRTVGAFEVYVDPASLEADIASITRRIWIAVGGVFAALYVLLALLVTNASRRLQAQNVELSQRSRALLESYEHLERSSLEIVETLNATVEAKDPYTAGHSQRVRKISLAIARRLGLASDDVELLGLAALFHDVGKIGIPDAILTKPGALTADEYEVMREHAARGAEIVSKLSDLAAAVPIVRHHHERWDGRGYPDGLAGEEIPLQAAIVALADAWDAMTTERPYARARTLTQALTEVVDARGSQFSPAVVDAFFDVVRQCPGELPRSADLYAAAG